MYSKISKSTFVLSSLLLLIIRMQIVSNLCSQKRDSIFFLVNFAEQKILAFCRRNLSNFRNTFPLKKLGLLEFCVEYSSQDLSTPKTMMEPISLLLVSIKYIFDICRGNLNYNLYRKPSLVTHIVKIRKV